MAIEPAAAEYAASRRTTAQLQGLTRASALFKRDITDTEGAVAAVVAFFTAVAAASGNQVLALSQAPLNVLLVPTLTQVIDGVPQARERIQAAQAKIIEAIKLKKSEQARTWMEKHIRDFKRGYDLKTPAEASA